MLKYYIDIHIQPCEEIPLSFLLTKTYTLIHKALARVSTEGKCPIGAAFPHLDEKNKEIGDIIRLFSEDQEGLENLKLSEILANFTDYISLTKINSVQNVKGYATYSKAHSKLSNSQIRRYAKRNNISEQDAFKKYHAPKHKDYPYIYLQSKSTGQGYMLQIRKTAQQEAKQGTFSTLGLSPEVTVPLF